MNNRIAIIGAGDLGQQIAHYITLDAKDRVVGYFDDTYEVGTRIGEVPILGNTKDITSVYKDGAFDALLIGVGYKHLDFKKKMFESQGAIPFATFIHSSAWVDPTAKVAAGTIVFPGCILDKNVSLKANTLLNIGCSISHDSTIGAHSFLSPRVAIAGFTHVGERCVLGINCTLIDNITIVQGCKIGAGAVVTNNCNEQGLYVGIPAKYKKKI